MKAAGVPVVVLLPEIETNLAPLKPCSNVLMKCHRFRSQKFSALSEKFNGNF